MTPRSASPAGSVPVVAATLVAVCDDLAVFRDALVAFLSTDPDVEVVATYADGPSLLEGLARRPVDVVLLDVRMPGMRGPEVARRLATLPSPPRVLYTTSYPGEVPLDDPLTGVVVGAITKELAPDDLVRVVKLAATGTTAISAGILSRYRTPQTFEDRRDAFALDDREREVLSLLCLGRSNDEIAEATFRSSSSVKQIISTMCHRAGVGGRTELVMHLLRT